MSDLGKKSLLPGGSKLSHFILYQDLAVLLPLTQEMVRVLWPMRNWQKNEQVCVANEKQENNEQLHVANKKTALKNEILIALLALPRSM